MMNTITTGEMVDLTKRLTGILSSNQPTEIKESRLNLLMTDLKEAYSIPMLLREEINEEYPIVMRLYQTASEERSSLGISKI